MEDEDCDGLFGMWHNIGEEGKRIFKLIKSDIRVFLAAFQLFFK
jgi:hypothetical protein